MEKQIGAFLLPGSVFLLILNLALGIEVCFLGTFRANCSSGNVIKIQSALYGRMRSSRCIHYSTIDLDCYANVQPYFEDMCNGHVECSVSASDDALRKAYNGRCLKILTPYLDVLYTCIHETQCDKINPPADVVVEDIANGHRLSCANDKDISWEVHCVNGTWLPESSRSCAATISSSKPTIPISKPAIPISKHTIPTSKHTIPTSKPIIPTSKPTIQTSKPTIPTSKPTIFTSKPTISTSKSTIPTSIPTIPTSKPTIPISNPTIPTSKPTIPTSKTTIPTSKPAKPISKRTVPTSKPAIPSSKPTISTSKPAITTSKPVTVVTPVVKKEMQDGDSSLTKKVVIIVPCATAALIILLATVSVFIHKHRQRNR